MIELFIVALKIIFILKSVVLLNRYHGGACVCMLS